MLLLGVEIDGKRALLRDGLRSIADVRRACMHAIVLFF